MDEWTIKTPNPICRLFFTIDILTGFAALCLTDFIDWRYIHSVVCIFDPGCELYPHGWRNNTCVLLPLYCTFSLTSPPPSQTKCTMEEQIPEMYYTVQYSIHYTDSVCECDWGGGDVELCCRPYSAVVTHSVSGQIQNLQNCYTTPNKWPVKTTLRGWCLSVPASMAHPKQTSTNCQRTLCIR